MAKEAVSTHILGYLLYLPELYLPNFQGYLQRQRYKYSWYPAASTLISKDMHNRRLLPKVFDFAASTIFLMATTTDQFQRAFTCTLYLPILFRVCTTMHTHEVIQIQLHLPKFLRVNTSIICNALIPNFKSSYRVIKSSA